MKVVINRCFGGFGLSEKAMLAYANRKGITLYPEKESALCTTYYTVPPERRISDPEDWHALTQEQRIAHNEAYSGTVLYDRDIPRDDPDLIAVVEELGGDASDKFAELKVVEIPDGVDYEINDYDGSEHIAEKHRTWS
jgi:hypothetical protein